MTWGHPTFGLVLRVAVFAVLGSVASRTSAQPLVHFDFAQREAADDWRPVHDVAGLQLTAEGMRIDISGGDPYIHGPARDYPTGVPLWLSLRLKTARPGTGQVFYFTSTRGANETDSVRFAVRGGDWEEVRLPLPALGPGHHLRLDPPGGAGDRVTIAWLKVEARVLLEEPAWPVPTMPRVAADSLNVRSGSVELVHARNRWGEFVVRVGGRTMAAGLNRTLIGYTLGGELRWIDVGAATTADVRLDGDELVAAMEVRDADGARWSVVHRFRAGESADTLVVTAEISVDHDRNVVFLPMFALLPGLGSFETTKSQALFAGLEYLGKNEPSSSEADIIGPGSRRQVPDTLKITFPLLAIQAEGRYVGLIWDSDPRFCAVFDSPDRLFGSGGHLMGVLYPGANGESRAEGSLLPYEGGTLKANQPLMLRAYIVGGPGESVVPAIRHYVNLRGLPPAPERGVDWDTYVATAAAGWLDSSIREGERYRHAWPGNFHPQAAADAAAMMDWLALHTKDAEVRQRLVAAARGAREGIAPESLNFAGVSHVRDPLPALVYGHAAENSARAREVARGLLSRFEPDGRVLYRQAPNRPDYARTHFAQDANGLTAQVVAGLLEAAAVCGDNDLIAEGLRRLEKLDHYANSVPRGAQTWEVPLHTPDILASANLVRAYTLGYELTGEARFLESAQYWAWTGVPFVYLVPPTDQPIGAYATIAVFGATNWVAPNWMGLPVQWCGLVYANALYRLSRCDPEGPWKRLADGITGSGVQQAWPLGDSPQRRGLLPDSIALRAQIRNDPAINPGTLWPNAVRLFDRPPIYDFRAFDGVLVHAPGEIRPLREEAGHLGFTVCGWPDHPYEVLITGLEFTPRIRIDGQDAALGARHRFQAAEGRLVLTLEGQPVVEILR